MSAKYRPLFFVIEGIRSFRITNKSDFPGGILPTFNGIAVYRNLRTDFSVIYRGGHSVFISCLKHILS